MTLFKRGDVLLVPFPFSDQSSSKKRPAIIISSDPFNRYSDDIFVIAVTSNITRREKLGDISIQSWQEAGLLKPSVIKPAISTIEKKLVIKTLGSLSHNDTISLNKTLSEIFALY